MADDAEAARDRQVRRRVPDEDHGRARANGTGALAELRDITKRFGAVTALDAVSMKVGRREVVGLVGQNGSGKSTLLKVFAGIHQPDGGEIRLHGRPVVLRSPHHARAMGVGMVFQEQSLLPDLTVAENIALGAEGLHGRAWGRYPWGAVRRLAKQQLDKIGSDIPVNARVEALSQLERQTVELAKVLTTELRAPSDALVLLDEPTSTLSQREIDVLFSQIQRLRQSSSVVFVSHRLDEVLEVCDRVYVLRDGRSVGERMREAWDHEEFFQLMVGRESARDYFGLERQQPHSEAICLSVQGLTKAGAYSDVSFDLHRGEVLGVCGVEGSAREKVMRTIFGADRADAGTILLDGAPLPPSSTEVAVRRGVAYIPAERTTEAALMEMDVAQNITISHLESVTDGPLIRQQSEHRLARDWIDRLAIRPPAVGALMSTLSGGNQQKVIFARWLLSPETRLLLLDHPTRGLDVGAKAEVYGIIRECAAAGTAILLISDSLEETIALSHRLIVMKDGMVTGNLEAPPGSKPDQLDVLERML